MDRNVCDGARLGEGDLEGDRRHVDRFEEGQVRRVREDWKCDVDSCAKGQDGGVVSDSTLCLCRGNAVTSPSTCVATARNGVGGAGSTNEDPV